MKQKPSKLDVYAERLDEWFSGGMTLEQAKARLAEAGCSVSRSRLGDWWAARLQEKQEDALLAQIATGARQHQDVVAEFSRNPAPELETIIKLHRVLILKLSTSANADPEMIELLARLMKPTMEFAKLQEKRRELELQEQKYRDLVAERKAAIEAELGKAKAKGGVTAETLEKIEAELRLL